jgi:hypothetical protein
MLATLGVTGHYKFVPIYATEEGAATGYTFRPKAHSFIRSTCSDIFGKDP